METKYYIIIASILIISRLISFIVYNFTDHHWSQKGFKEEHFAYGQWYIISRLFTIVVLVHLLYSFTQWFISI